MGIIVSLLRSTKSKRASESRSRARSNSTSLPAALISHPYPLGARPDAHIYSAPSSPTNTNTIHHRSIRRTLSLSRSFPARARSLSGPRNEILTKPELRHRLSHGPKDPADEVQGLLSFSSRPTSPTSPISDSERDPYMTIATARGTIMGNRRGSVAERTGAGGDDDTRGASSKQGGRQHKVKLRKVLKVDGDWDYWRETDWEGYRRPTQSGTIERHGLGDD